MTDSDPTDCNTCHDNNATHYSYYECDSCNEPIGPVEAVPVAELEDLVEEWRETPEYLKLHRGMWEAADDLEEVLERYE